MTKTQRLPIKNPIKDPKITIKDLLGFDFSMGICILHHCKDPLAVLREMKRISRKVIIQEPNKRNLLVSSFITLTPIRHTEDLNAHYDREGFKDVVKKSGSSIDQFYAQDVFFYPNVYYWAVCS